MEHGNMTVRQLAWFFDRPYQTVYTWVYRNREPYGFYQGEVLNRLAVLESLVAKAFAKKKPLVPKDFDAGERELHVKQLFADASVSRRAAAN